MATHPLKVILPAPFKVSAFIRFCRYAALSTGIVWGLMRSGQIRRSHERKRPIEHEKFVKEYNAEVERRRVAGIDSAKDLARQAGQPENSFLGGK